MKWLYSDILNEKKGLKTLVILLVTVNAIVLAVLLFGPSKKPDASVRKPENAAGSSQASGGEAGSGTDASAGADAKKPEELLGTKFPDFTMKTVDGGTFTLSEALKEKQVVLINMFATWCGPCKMEFPEMIRSYEERKDYVDVFAFSHDHENGDSEEKLKKFAEDFKLPFHVAYDDDLALDTFSAFRGIPATIVVDRFGTICFVQSGCFFNKGQIDRVLDTFIGDDYTDRDECGGRHARI